MRLLHRKLLQVALGLSSLSVASLQPGVAAELQPGDLVVVDRGWAISPPQLDSIDPSTPSRVTLPAPEPRLSLLRSPQDVVVSQSGAIFVADREWVLEVDPGSGDHAIVARAAAPDMILEEPVGIGLAPTAASM